MHGNDMSSTQPQGKDGGERVQEKTHRDPLSVISNLPFFKLQQIWHNMTRAGWCLLEQ